MSVASSPTIVGVFRDRQAVEQAIEALYQVGFNQDQIRYSVPGSAGSFLNDLKSLFTGTTTDSGDLLNKLTSMGLSQEEARYYSNEYENGNIVLAVNALNHEQEALTIFHQYGGYGIYNTQQTANAYNQPANDDAQPTTNDYAQQPAPSTWDEETTEHPALNNNTYNNQDNVATPENIANDQKLAAHDAAPTDHAATDNYATDPLDTTDQATTHDQYSNQTTTDNYAADPLDTTDQANPEHSTDHDTTNDYQTAPDATAEHDRAADDGYQSAQTDATTPDYQNEEQPAIEDVPTQTFAYDSHQADSYNTHDNVDTHDNVSAAEEQAPVDSQSDNTTHTNQYDQADSTTSEYAPVDQTTTDTTTPDETNTDHHITPVEEAPAIAADTTTHEATSAHQDTLVDTPASTETTPTNQDTPVSSTDQVTPLDNQSASTPTTPGLQAEKLRLLQQRLESAQQRLQESKAQLQAAKEHETQLQAVKQQLDAIEAELQKNDAELQETHARIEQYY